MSLMMNHAVVNRKPGRNLFEEINFKKLDKNTFLPQKYFSRKIYRVQNNKNPYLCCILKVFELFDFKYCKIAIVRNVWDLIFC